MNEWMDGWSGLYILSSLTYMYELSRPIRTGRKITFLIALRMKGCFAYILMYTHKY